MQRHWIIEPKLNPQENFATACANVRTKSNISSDTKIACQESWILTMLLFVILCAACAIVARLAYNKRQALPNLFFKSSQSTSL